MGGKLHSPDLAYLWSQIGLWQLVGKKLRGCKIALKLIEAKAKKVDGIKRFMREITIKEADKELKRSHQEYHQFLKGDNPTVRRETFLDDLATARAKEEDKDKASIIRQLKNRERDAQANRQINYAYKDKRKGITFVVAKNPRGQVVEMNRKEDIEKACREILTSE